MTKPAEAERVAERRLREAGLRVTRPRLLVYTALREAGGHRSADEIVALLAERDHRIPRMSVYNVAADLAAASLLMTADAGPGPALFEVSETWHHHFVCPSCGRIEDVPCLRGKEPCLEPPARLRGRVDEAQVIFRGTCDRCVKPTKRTGVR